MMGLTFSGSAYLATTNGNVGIGTTSPSQLLSVAGNGYFTGMVGIGAVPTYSLDVQSSQSGSWETRIYNTHATAGYGLLVQAGNDATNKIMALRDVGGTERVTVLGNGNVGIGTTGPGFKLEVMSAYNDGLQVTDTTRTVYGGFFTEATTMALVTRSNHGLRFGTNDATRMVIDNLGNVGIGTTSPS